jgi:predicted regulator of Ras-like GTPase activity (Roadblock/LC7/MglB family)
MTGNLKMGGLGQITLEAGEKKCIIVPYGDLFLCLLTRADTNLGLIRLAIRNLQAMEQR